MKNKLMNKIRLLLLFVLKIIPIKEGQFYFISFHGLYADSGRYISEMLHEERPTSKIIWEISSKSNEKLPDYIIPVEPNSLKSAYYISTSQIIIDNYLGWMYGHVEHRLKAIVLQKLKKKGQTNISTWHGTPLKMINTDEPVNRGKEFFFYSTSDMLVCSNRFTLDIFERQNQGVIKNVICGSPKNDLLFSDNRKRHEIKQRLGIETEKKVLLYAPTFRDSKELNEFILLFDYESIIRTCQKRFGGEWVVIFRVHDSLIEKCADKIHNNSKLIAGNDKDDMALYLSIADILITDYSSCMFDFLLTRKPCFLYCPDIDNYASEERGLYFDMDDLPFSVATSLEKIQACILNYSDQTYQTRVDDFLQLIGNYDNGNATQHFIYDVLMPVL